MCVWFMIKNYRDMFFVVRSNDSFNFPLGLIKYIVIVTPLPPPPPPVHPPQPSLISLMVSVDVKHHVYLLTFATP